jgi:hypothetical protein
MAKDIILANQSDPIIKNPFTPPLISTRVGERDGTRAEPVPPYQSIGLLFSENFNDQPDWHSGLEINATAGHPAGLPDRIQRAATHTIPEGWYSIYQDPVWSPSLGHVDRHETIEILAANSALSRSGTGKCMVQRRDGLADPGHLWTSDGQMFKFFEQGFPQMYVEFWISFSENWTYAPSEDGSKIFRMGSWSGEGSEYQALGGGEQGPLFIFSWSRNTHGVRNSHTLRGGPHGDNYLLTASQKGSHPRGSMNFNADTIGMGINGTTPQIPDKLNGGLVPSVGAIEHTQIYGPPGTYTKIAFFMAVNSSPGAQDGVLMQWLDDQQILSVHDINWVPSLTEGVTEMPKLNFFSIGGNDYFKAYPNSDRRQEYWTIDDVVCRDSIPEELL